MCEMVIESFGILEVYITAICKDLIFYILHQVMGGSL